MMPDESTLTGRPVAFTWLQCEGNSLELKNPASHRNEAKNRLEVTARLTDLKGHCQ